MPDELSIGVVGAGGRMGRMVIRAVVDADDCTLHGAVDAAGSAAVGADAGTLAGVGDIGVTVGDDPAPLFAEAQAVIDFTRPDATVGYAALAAQGKTVHVIGTTGLDAAHEDRLVMAARHTQIVYAPNMSVGVTLLVSLAERVARVLDDGFDVEVLEMHHRHKVDAPSGTALALGRAAAAGRGVEHDAVALRGRDGITGERPRGGIGYAVLRGGGVVGEHSVVFASDDERVELVHKAARREVFAAGALRAARWARGQSPGLYAMTDVLGL